jgi:hypothetical protein
MSALSSDLANCMSTFNLRPHDTELPHPGRSLQQKREAREAKDQQALDKLISKVRVCLPLYEPEQAENTLTHATASLADIVCSMVRMPQQWKQSESSCRLHCCPATCGVPSSFTKSSSRCVVAAMLQCHPASGNPVAKCHLSTGTHSA